MDGRKLTALFLSACLVLAGTHVSYAVVIGGEDFDGGATNGGFTPANRVLTPDNTAFNALFGSGGNFFDRFGIATVDIAPPDGILDLPFDVVDESLGSFPGDRAGVIPQSKVDNVFVMVDLENGDNPISPMGMATWDFDISGFSDLSVAMDFGAIGNFGTDGGGRIDSFVFSYSIDGGASQTLFDIQSLDDNALYQVSMLDGGQYVDTGGNFFFDQAEWDALGCNPGVANSCAVGDVTVGSSTVRTDPLDLNNDGYIYADDVNVVLTDTPLDSMDIEAGKVSIYEETNSFGTFSNPEVELLLNQLVIDGDANRAIPNQLTTFAESILGTGTTLTLSLVAEQYGGDEYLVFDNIVIEGTLAPVIDADFNDDGEIDDLDIDALTMDIATMTNNVATYDLNGDGVVDLDDVTQWLADGGEANLPSMNPYLVGDATLDGVVDGQDFIEWNENKFDPTGKWTQGDFNADGVTDGQDFIEWNNNKFMTSDGVSAVPEPGLSTLAILLGMAVAAARRNRS